jgi:hypothetical protein
MLQRSFPARSAERAGCLILYPPATGRTAQSSPGCGVYRVPCTRRAHLETCDRSQRNASHLSAGTVLSRGPDVCRT